MTNGGIGNSGAPKSDAWTLSVGGISVAVVSEDPALRLRVPEETEPFLVSNGGSDATIRAAWGELREPPMGSRLFDSGALWQLYQHDTQYVFRFASPIFGALPYKEASFDPGFTSGRVVLQSDFFERRDAIDPLEYPLDELLIVNLLAQGRGVELHACGIEDSDGRGLLFLGQSGAGKTTTARLWEKAGIRQILSDDRIILRCLDGQVWMYGTPWHGEAALASPARVPLSGMFFLQKRAANEMTPLRPAEAVARLLACAFVPFHVPAAMEFTLEFLQTVAGSVPCAELGFFPDGRAVEFVRERAA